MSSLCTDIGQWGILEVSADEGQALFRIRTDTPQDPGLADLPRFPLTIEFISDPDWEQWESIRQHAAETD